MGAVMVRMVLLSAIALVAIAAPASAQIYFGNAEVIDGDTLEMSGTRFRLFGIDAVEKQQTCERASETWHCGADATIALEALISGRAVSCTQRDRDRYGRVVATCTVNNRDLAEQMVAMGYAVALPNFTTAYVGQEDMAKARQVGIWSGTLARPADFRAADPAFAARDEAMLAKQEQELAAAEQRTRQAGRAGVYYRNCREARAAGAAPLYRGQPGYGAHMDGDGDGIACEPYRGRR